MTFEASIEKVLATMPPQPRSNDRAMTLPLVPGGPEPSTNGFSNFMPLTVMPRSVTSPPGVPRVGSCDRRESPEWGNGWANTGPMLDSTAFVRGPARNVRTASLGATAARQVLEPARRQTAE